MSKRRDHAHGSWVFVEGMDSYEGEFTRWKKTDIIRGLIGVFEISDEVFGSGIEAQLDAVGKGHCKVQWYNADVDNTGVISGAPESGAGSTAAVKDQYGKVRPVIFLRENVQLDLLGEYKAQGTAMLKLLVLLHELGHADDINRGINYDHAAMKVDLVSAEVYAHKFAFAHAQRMNYRLGIRHYLSNIEEHVKSEHDSIRLPAQQVLSEVDIAALREIAANPGIQNTPAFRRRLTAAGRLKDVQEYARKLRSES